jgi:hypothetical protein
VQIQGFMDQITPSAENISTFYKASVAEIQAVIAGLLDEMDFNFGWDQDRPEYIARLEASKQHLLNWKKDGYKVCYLGDATIGRGYLPPILELWELSRQQLDGYLCMGTPNVDLGLRWKGVTDEMMLAIRQLYREKIFVK